jgi:hypothetical protein
VEELPHASPPAWRFTIKARAGHEVCSSVNDPYGTGQVAGGMLMAASTCLAGEPNHDCSQMTYTSGGGNEISHADAFIVCCPAPTAWTTAGTAANRRLTGDEDEEDEEDDSDSDGEGGEDDESDSDGEGGEDGDSDSDGEGDGDDESNSDGDGDGDGDSDSDGEGDGDDESDSDGDGDGDGVSYSDGEGNGDDESDSNGEGDGDDESDSDGEGDRKEDFDSDGEGSVSDSDGEGDDSDSDEEAASPSPPPSPPPPSPPSPPPSLPKLQQKSPSPPHPVPITCETLLSTGTKLGSIGTSCMDLTEEACGTLNYVLLSGKFSQCGFRRGQCLAKYGKLVCPVPVSAPAPSHSPVLVSAPPRSPPPFAPSPTALTCETLLATGKNLQATGEWCYDLKTEAACGTLNYVPMDGTFRQCAFKNGACSAKHGHVLVCPVATAP